MRPSADLLSTKLKHNVSKEKGQHFVSPIKTLSSPHRMFQKVLLFEKIPKFDYIVDFKVSLVEK